MPEKCQVQDQKGAEWQRIFFFSARSVYGILNRNRADDRKGGCRVDGASVSFLFFILFLLAGLAFTVFSDPYIRREHRKSLLLIIGLCASLAVQNCWEYALSVGPLKQLERQLVCIYGYSVRPVIIVLIFPLIAPKTPKKRFWPAWALVGINAAVHMTALFSYICFTITEHNRYYGGPLKFFCVFTSLLLLAYLLYLIIRESRGLRPADKAMPVLSIVLILIAVWLDVQDDGNSHAITFLTVALSVSCVFYYLWLHLQFVREHEEDLKARQRIQIMTSQIQPHFLYNTLSTIQALCHTDPGRAAGITENFGAYLRQNLASLNENGLIPFQKELEHTRIYVGIEETRFPNIHVRYDIQDGDFSLPPLTLQPIVENAIRHGVRIREEGIIQIVTRRREDGHEILVRDNGVGFDVKTLENADESHIGLMNVRDRVEGMCGGTLTVDSWIGEGTSVAIFLPTEKNWKG